MSRPNRAARTFLIVQTGTTLPALRARRGDFPHWFRCALGLPRAAVDVVRVDVGTPLPDAGAHRAVIVTGSAAMVTDAQPWSEAAAAWLRELVRAGRTPVLGVCYGHQLLAHALGGRVDWNPQGREIGTQWLQCTPGVRGDALFGGLPPRFRAQTTHQQSVVAPPSGAQVLATSERDAAQGVRYGERAWGMQFHPEFSAGVMAGYVRGRAAALRAEGLAPEALLAANGPAPEARRLLRRFVALAST